MSEGVGTIYIHIFVPHHMMNVCTKWLCSTTKCMLPPHHWHYVADGTVLPFLISQMWNTYQNIFFARTEWCATVNCKFWNKFRGSNSCSKSRRKEEERIIKPASGIKTALAPPCIPLSCPASYSAAPYFCPALLSVSPPSQSHSCPCLCNTDLATVLASLWSPTCSWSGQQSCSVATGQARICSQFHKSHWACPPSSKLNSSWPRPY